MCFGHTLPQHITLDVLNLSFGIGGTPGHTWNKHKIIQINKTFECWILHEGIAVLNRRCFNRGKMKLLLSANTIKYNSSEMSFDNVTVNIRLGRHTVFSLLCIEHKKTTEHAYSPVFRGPFALKNASAPVRTVCETAGTTRVTSARRV